MLDQREAVHAGHYQVLENHRGLDLVGNGQGFTGVGAVVKIDVGLIGQRPADGFANHGLVVHQQHHHVVLAGMHRALLVQVQVVDGWFVSHAL